MKRFRILPAVILVFALSSCDQGPSTRTKELRAEIDQVNENYFEAQQTAKRLQSQLDAARQEKTKLEDAVKKAEEDKEASKKELERVRMEFDVYKSKYKVSIRSRVPGLMMPDFELGGKSYQEVVVTQLDDQTLAFKHTGGLGKLSLKDLPEMVRDVLALTPNHAVHENEEPGRPVSLKKQLLMKTNKIKEEDMALEDQFRANSAARTTAVRELGEANGKLERARLNGGDTVLLDKYVGEVELHIKQLDAERTKLEVQRHELSQRRMTIR